LPDVKNLDKLGFNLILWVKATGKKEKKKKKNGEEGGY